MEFMIEQIFRNSYIKYFFAHTVSKLAQFTPFSSINIPPKWELLIISAKFLPLYCASIYKSSLIESSSFPSTRELVDKFVVVELNVGSGGGTVEGPDIWQVAGAKYRDPTESGWLIRANWVIGVSDPWLM